jgi:hypothetical protein
LYWNVSSDQAVATKVFLRLTAQMMDSVRRPKAELMLGFWEVESNRRAYAQKVFRDQARSR